MGGLVDLAPGFALNNSSHNGFVCTLAARHRQGFSAFLGNQVAATPTNTVVVAANPFLT